MNLPNVPILQGPFKALFMVGGTGSGRKTAAQIVAGSGAVRPMLLDAFYFELRERCHAAYKLFDQQRLPAPANYFEPVMNEPQEMFMGKTPASAYAQFTKFVHEAMGREAMGVWMTQRLRYFRQSQEQRIADGLIANDRRVRGAVIIDEAPLPAYAEVVKYIGAENCTQLVITRDNINAIPKELAGVRTCRVRNPGDSVAAFETAIRNAAPHLFIEIATSL